jgi:hypothetical protein
MLQDTLVTIQDDYAQALAAAAARENAAALRAGFIGLGGNPHKKRPDATEQHIERAKGQVLDLLAKEPLSSTDMMPRVTGNKHLVTTALNALIVEGKITRDNHRTGQKILYRLAG